MALPLNQACLTCGSMDFLEPVTVGETLCKKRLEGLGIPLNEGDDVLICLVCYVELGQ